VHAGVNEALVEGLTACRVISGHFSD